MGKADGQATPLRHIQPKNLDWGELPPPFTLESILDRAAQKWPDRVAVDFYDTVYTFRDLRTLALQAARGFADLGVVPGVNVALHLPNTPHFLVCFFGILIAGGCVVNLSPLAGMIELREQLSDAGAQILVTGDWLPQYSQLRQLAGAGALRGLVTCSLLDFLAQPRARELVASVCGRTPAVAGESPFAALIANDATVTRPQRGALEEELAVLQYTGGTTGEPKAAMLTHANFAASLHTSLRLSGAASARVLKELVILPLHHMFGLSVMLRIFCAGSQLVMHIRFDAGRVLADIENKKINTIAAVPSMFSRLVTHPDFAECDFSSLNGYVSAGAPLPKNLRSSFERHLELMMGDVYGLTETTGVGTVPSPLARGKLGVPAPFARVEVVDLETGLAVLPPGEVGELCITGPHVMKGYWNRPAETAAAFRGGRFHTGDIGFIDAAGYITLCDRKKDIILTGGHNVYPRNIERAIQEHPAVAEAAVVGIPHRDFGEVAKAFVVLKPGHEPFSCAQLCRFLTGRLASYEIPLEMEIRLELPQTDVAKVSKQALLSQQSTPTAGGHHG